MKIRILKTNRKCPVSEHILDLRKEAYGWKMMSKWMYEKIRWYES